VSKLAVITMPSEAYIPRLDKPSFPNCAFSQVKLYAIRIILYLSSRQ